MEVKFLFVGFFNSICVRFLDFQGHALVLIESAFLHVVLVLFWEPKDERRELGAHKSTG